MTEAPSNADGSDGRVDEPVSASATAHRPPFFRRHWGKLTMLVLVLAPVVIVGLWAAVALNYTYSSGKRAGYLQKFSSKGWLCKTWEGTLYTDIAKGFRSDSFVFTVRNDSLATIMQDLSGKRVAINYDQHVGVPTSCFGETEYFVKGVEVIPD